MFRFAQLARWTQLGQSISASGPSWLSETRRPGDGDRFESRVDAEGAKEPADVVSDGLDGQVEFGCDLLCRAALFEKTKHLDLPGGEMWVRRCGFFVGVSLQQPKDADYSFTAHERHRADLHGHSGSGG